MSDVWLFGYGSLIWRPDFPYLDRRPARVAGWSRRFWQGSHDHRGVPHAPGRVVTLVPDPTALCEGMAYRIEREVRDATFAQLDHREKNGYERHDAVLEFRDGATERGIVYIATHDNHAFLGPAPAHEIAAQIHASAGPSGRNREYLVALAVALRELGVEDPHVAELESLLPD
jgi:cation transport regulator ChaC